MQFLVEEQRKINVNVDIPATEWCNIAFHDIVPQMQRYTLRHPFTNAACA